MHYVVARKYQSSLHYSSNRLQVGEIAINSTDSDEIQCRFSIGFSHFKPLIFQLDIFFESGQGITYYFCVVKLEEKNRKVYINNLNMETMKKKTILVSLIALITIGTTGVNAQTPIYWGVKGEMNLSNFLLSDFDLLSSKMKVGPNLGGFMRVELHENFALQPELSFFYRNAKMEALSEDDTFKQWGMQLPIYALGQYRTYNGLFYGGIGPFVGLGFDARLDDLDIDLYKEVAGKTPMNRWDFGLGLLLGYEFNSGFQVNAGYQFGLVNQADELTGLKNVISGSDDAKMRTQTVNIGIGYRF